jgi:hypothetical protein
MKLFSAKGITKSLKIPKEVIRVHKSEKDANKIVKRKRTKPQTAIYKNTSKTLGNMNSTNSCSRTISSAYSTSGTRSFRGSSET